MILRFLYLVGFLLLSACVGNTAKIENTKKGSLQATTYLKPFSTQQYLLDEKTAPRPEYIQIYMDKEGRRNLAFLNAYNHSIYLYDYNTRKFKSRITYQEDGPNGVKWPKAFYIKNMDSIYIYEMRHIQLLLTNSKGEVIHKRSMKIEEDSKDWYKHYPQYLPRTINPIIEVPDGLLLTGQYIWSLSEERIDQFKFTAKIDFGLNNVNFYHSYPKELYGHSYNWQGAIPTTVYQALHPDGDKMIYSFPVSHELYIADFDTLVYKKVYAGSNTAKTIHSINKAKDKTTPEIIRMHFVSQDMYAGILYDKYRKVYYRFLRSAIPKATIDISVDKKPIVVIILDGDFNYLGETVIGTGEEWNWENSFVTEEGLNIEYIDKTDDEKFLHIKTFIPQEIN